MRTIQNQKSDCAQYFIHDVASLHRVLFLVKALVNTMNREFLYGDPHLEIPHMSIVPLKSDLHVKIVLSRLKFRLKQGDLLVSVGQRHNFLSPKEWRLWLIIIAD